MARQNPDEVFSFELKASTAGTGVVNRADQQNHNQKRFSTQRAGFRAFRRASGNDLM
jgi:hypothetical protein